jgi:hypothetical protein
VQLVQQDPLEQQDPLVRKEQQVLQDYLVVEMQQEIRLIGMDHNGS